MGAIFSKLCFSCCTGKSRRHSKQPPRFPSSSSSNPSLIIQRSHFFRDVEEGSEYTRVLERDFEVRGKRVVECAAETGNAEGSNYFGSSSSSGSLQVFNDYPKKVFQVKHKESSQLFTLTRIKKSHLDQRSAAQLFREISLLARDLPHHPFLVNLYWTWQDARFLYRVDEANSEDESLPLSIDVSQTSQSIGTWEEFVFRAGQLATIVHYIHSYGLIHGNINPQSIRFTASDTLKLGSFQYLRRVEGGRRLSGVCGDLEGFRAPECRNSSEYFEEIDWYSYGKVLQFWYNQNRDRLAPNGNQSHFPALLDDLITKLTDESRSEVFRLGYGPAAFKSIQSHAFFASLPWQPLLQLSTRPDFKSSFASLSESIGSLKGPPSTAREDDWREFLEFNWDEGCEIGQTLESIIINR